MKIIRAEHLGMCFGVRDAIELAGQQARKGPLTILGDLVHNETVLAELKSRGIRIAQRPDEVQTGSVMITAHGASEAALKQARERGLHVSEATCPLVHFAHRAVARLVSEGCHPVIIGKRDHVEVRGLTGDLKEFDIVLTDSDLENLKERARFGVAAQTTQPIERVRRLVELLRQRFPKSEVRFVDTVCQPTKQRQSSAIELAKLCDVVIVIGGTHSNNTHELVGTCRLHCARVYQVQTATDLREEWFGNAQVVGLTAGTSTPDSNIAEVESWIRTRCEEKGTSQNEQPRENASQPVTPYAGALLPARRDGEPNVPRKPRTEREGPQPDFSKTDDSRTESSKPATKRPEGGAQHFAA